jgi:hypothetical protein
VLRFGVKLLCNSSGEVFMVPHDCARVSSVRFLTGLILVIAACGFAVRIAHAVPCAVVRHGPLSDADKAYLAANYKTSEDLYRAQLAASPGDPASTQGLVHALLREEKVPEAADAGFQTRSLQPQGPPALCPPLARWILLCYSARERSCSSSARSRRS